MYFRSKEELFLRLLREELAEWYSELEAKLDPGDGSLSQSEIAALLATSISKRPELTRFLSLEAVVLEQEVALPVARRLIESAGVRVSAPGRTLVRAIPHLDVSQADVDEAGDAMCELSDRLWRSRS